MYSKLAYFYDSLVDADYEQIINEIKSNIKTGSKVLDLACGTGTVINALKDSYDMIGVDISEDMLEIAREKNPNVDLFIHDLRDDFFLEGLDAIICNLDSINYLLLENEVEKLLKNVSDNLKGGIFIFDVHAHSKLETLRDYLSVDLDHDVSYIWKVDIKKDFIYHYLTFFIKDKDNYVRFDEEHVQKVYSQDFYEKLLSKYSFDFSVKYLEDRILFVCNKR
ncbi:class I SAM-dependent methyltransferase [Mycoplasmatota bacterium]|nr:class I SAM-dependent methyltransferase [Mycoplasmatota bacterium]